MDFSNYSAKDFVLDESFQKWILAPDEETNTFWNDWMLKHPEKAEIVEEAKTLIRNIGCVIEKNVAQDSKEVWERILKQINPSK